MKVRLMKTMPLITGPALGAMCKIWTIPKKSMGALYYPALVRTVPIPKVTNLAKTSNMIANLLMVASIKPPLPPLYTEYSREQ